jgi:hypothetical protein
VSIDPRPVRCGLYLPGHEVHVIQALHSSNDRENRPIDGYVMRIDDDGVLEVQIQGEHWHLWNHEPERLATLCARNRNRMSLQWPWRVLRTPSRDGSYLFCVALADACDLKPCPPEPPSGECIELLRTAGGFLGRFERSARPLAPPVRGS